MKDKIKIPLKETLKGSRIIVNISVSGMRYLKPRLFLTTIIIKIASYISPIDVEIKKI